MFYSRTVLGGSLLLMFENKHFEWLVSRYSGNNKALAEDLMEFGLLMKTPPICARKTIHKKENVAEMCPQYNKWRWRCQLCKTSLSFNKRSFMEGLKCRLRKKSKLYDL